MVEGFPEWKEARMHMEMKCEQSFGKGKCVPHEVHVPCWQCFQEDRIGPPDLPDPLDSIGFPPERFSHDIPEG